MKISLQSSSINHMINFCKKHIKGQTTQTELEDILQHDDYKVEFERYSNPNLPTTTITKNEFIEYFMNIFSQDEESTQNSRLLNKHQTWLNFFNNIEQYQARLEEYYSLSEEEISTVETLLENAFPAKYLSELEDITCIFTLSIGDSMGYPHKNFIHFDVLNLHLVGDKETFINFIAHEIHHIIYSKIMSKELKQELTPLEYFLVLFSYEGLAVKFCNNGTGKLTPPMYATRSNIGQNEETFDFYNQEFEFMLDEFMSDYQRIKNDSLSMEQVQRIVGEKWLTGNITSFIDGSKKEVSLYRVYYLGMQLYGMIYDDLGLVQMFKTILNTQELIKYFENNIIKKESQ